MWSPKNWLAMALHRLTNSVGGMVSSHSVRMTSLYKACAMALLCKCVYIYYIFIYLFIFIIGFIGTPELTLWCSCRFFSKAKRPEYLSISFETVLLRSQHHFCLLCGHPAGKVEDSVPGHPECALLTIPPCRFVAFKAESTSLKGMDSHQLKIPALAH